MEKIEPNVAHSFHAPHERIDDILDVIKEEKNK